MDLARIFALWEATEPVSGRSARMLAVAGEREPGALSLGMAARRIMKVRETFAPPQIAAVADCNSCGQRHDVNLDTIMFDADAASEPLIVEHAGWRAQIRLPSLDDIAAAAQCANVQDAAELLAARAVKALEGPPGEPPPPSLLLAIEEALDAADPLADPRIALTCVSCGSMWTASFDPAEFLAAEIATIARQQLAEVATLARAYGWSEADILAMPAARRRAYRALAE